MALTTEAIIEQVHRIDFSAAGWVTADITKVIAHATVHMERFCRRELEHAASIALTLDQPDLGTEIRLWQTPITAITSVTEDGTLLVVTTDYRWYSDGKLVRVSGDFDLNWAQGRQKIVVDYAGGYQSSDPEWEALESVCSDIVARAFKQAATWAAAATTQATTAKRVRLEGEGEIEYSDAVTMAAVVSNMHLTDENKELLEFARRPLHRGAAPIL
jgi:hypothetical protein